MNAPDRTHSPALDFLRRMAELPASDPEVAHMLADDYLMRYLVETGQTAVASAFEDARKRVGFQYAKGR